MVNSQNLDNNQYIGKKRYSLKKILKWIQIVFSMSVLLFVFLKTEIWFIILFYINFVIFFISFYTFAPIYNIYVANEEIRFVKKRGKELKKMSTENIGRICIQVDKKRGQGTLLLDLIENVKKNISSENILKKSIKYHYCEDLKLSNINKIEELYSKLIKKKNATNLNGQNIHGKSYKTLHERFSKSKYNYSYEEQSTSGDISVKNYMTKEEQILFYKEKRVQKFSLKIFMILLLIFFILWAKFVPNGLWPFVMLLALYVFCYKTVEKIWSFEKIIYVVTDKRVFYISEGRRYRIVNSIFRHKDFQYYYNANKYKKEKEGLVFIFPKINWVDLAFFKLGNIKNGFKSPVISFSNLKVSEMEAVLKAFSKNTL